MPGLSKRAKRLQKQSLQAETATAPKARESGWRRRIAGLRLPDWAKRIAVHPATSYIALFLLQLRVIWGIWWYKDMTSGDTSMYFQSGVRWFREGIVPFLWSPLYTSFIGELFHFSEDAYTILILHRVLIVLILAVLVLRLMRGLLPPGVAWIAAAWWVVLPINFNALYEVHLFAVIPMLCAVLAVVWKPGPWGRGSAVAILLVTGLLMRNEELAAAGLMAVLSAAYEVWMYFKSGDGKSLSEIAYAYGAPLLCAVVFSAFYYFHRTPDPFAEILRLKHNLNTCQVFAAGYQQRNTDFTQSIWTDCGQLMQRVFGSPDISMADAFKANPSAMLGHFWWNLRLLPSGLQVLLFNFRSGAANPDYAPTYQTDWVLIPSAAACAILALALYLFLAGRRRTISHQVWPWIVLGCLSLVVGGIILTNRPRPSYMLILGIALRAALALSFCLVRDRWSAIRIPAAGLAVLVAAAAFLSPSIYQLQPSPRPLLNDYRILAPYERFFKEPGHKLVSTEFGTELSVYAGKCNCDWTRFDELRKRVSAEHTLPQVFDDAGATLFLADNVILADPLARQFVEDAARSHWEVVRRDTSGLNGWALLHKIR
jgi:hypothetical protein